MTTESIATAVQRVEAVLQRRPDLGLHDDAPASARWQGDLRVVTHHANGRQVASDMPAEFGGGGAEVTPGWLFRAGLASCTATTIAKTAAAQGIELATLEVLASSRSDTRGFLGMADAGGEPVSAAPQDLQLVVRISAHGVEPQRLRALVEEGYRCSPVPSALRSAVPLDLHIDINAA